MKVLITRIFVLKWLTFTYINYCYGVATIGVVKA